jgi:uncharacterized RDD family membrane protein YckC
MTEGLGINHFADGLPYASHKRKNQVQFRFPQQPSANIQQPKQVQSTSSLKIEIETLQFTPAPFHKRILAFGFDLLSASTLFAFIVWASFAINGFDLSTHMQLTFFWPLTLFYFVLLGGYFLIQESTWGCTLGKSLFGLHIRTHSSLSSIARLGRSFLFLLSIAPFGIGLFWYFFDSQKRCWHDVVSNCEVVH